MQRELRHISTVRRAHAFTERQAEGHFPGTTALGEGRVSIGVRTKGLQHALEMFAAVTVGEQGDAVPTVTIGDSLHFSGDVGEGLVPGHRFERLCVALSDPDQGPPETVRVAITGNAAGTAGTQAAIAVWIGRIAQNLPRFTVLRVQRGSTLPETDVAHCRCRADLAGTRQWRRRAAAEQTGHDAGCPEQCADLEELSPLHDGRGLITSCNGRSYRS